MRTILYTTAKIIIPVLVVTVLMSSSALAQRKPATKMYYGIEGTVGTRSFKINSNIADIDKVRPFFSGQDFGIVLGGKKIHARIRQGYFKTEASASQKFKLIETEAATNIYPLQLAKKKFRYFEPYFFSGVDRSSIKFYGTYAGSLKKVGEEAKVVPAGTLNTKPTTATGTPTAEGGGTLVCCCDDGTLPANPYQLIELQGAPMGNPTSASATLDNDLTAGPVKKTNATPVDGYIGKVMVTRATVGFGLECHVPGANHFINLFAELKYGFALNATSKSDALRSTRAAGQMVVNFGLSFGLSK